MRAGMEEEAKRVGRVARAGGSFIAAALSAGLAWAALVLLSSSGTFVPVEQAFGCILLVGSAGGLIAWAIAGLVPAERGRGEPPRSGKS
jgi:hypothetical protein